LEETKQHLKRGCEIPETIHGKKLKDFLYIDTTKDDENLNSRLSPQRQISYNDDQLNEVDNDDDIITIDISPCTTLNDLPNNTNFINNEWNIGNNLISNNDNDIIKIDCEPMNNIYNNNNFNNHQNNNVEWIINNNNNSVIKDNTNNINNYFQSKLPIIYKSSSAVIKPKIDKIPIKRCGTEGRRRNQLIAPAPSTNKNAERWELCGVAVIESKNGIFNFELTSSFFLNLIKI
jgi:hypothetical protein